MTLMWTDSVHFICCKHMTLLIVLNDFFFTWVHKVGCDVVVVTIQYKGTVYQLWVRVVVWVEWVVFRDLTTYVSKLYNTKQQYQTMLASIAFLKVLVKVN